MSSDEEFNNHIDNTINDEVDAVNDNNTVDEPKTEPRETIQRQKKKLSKEHLEK